MQSTLPLEIVYQFKWETPTASRLSSLMKVHCRPPKLVSSNRALSGRPTPPGRPAALEQECLANS